MAAHIIFRMMHQKLADSHNLLMSTYIESTKRLCMEDHTPLLNPTTPLMPLHAPNPDGANLMEYLRSDYPDIHYWTRKEWKDFENKSKNSSGLKGKGA